MCKGFYGLRLEFLNYSKCVKARVWEYEKVEKGFTLGIYNSSRKREKWE